MGIRTIGIIGLGALGTMYGDYMTQKLPDGSVSVIADKTRVERYQQEGVFCNEKRCTFKYVEVGKKIESFDLLLFTVKFSALKAAIEDARPYIGKDTIILSMLNGIVSEEMIREQLGSGHLLYCTVQGMDAVKEGNQATYAHMGYVAFGEKDNTYSDQVKQVEQLFKQIELPYKVAEDMMHQMWGKLLLNVGVNQAVAVFETNYGGVQQDGEARECMIGAMKEVLEIAKAEHISMNKNELAEWLDILDTLSPEGKPSLRQDTEANRKTEVELFAGTIRKFGKIHDIPTPFNDFLYQKIKLMEDNYSK